VKRDAARPVAVIRSRFPFANGADLADEWEQDTDRSTRAVLHRVNHTKPMDANGRPFGDGRHLRDTDQVARGGMSILQDLKSPSWEGRCGVAPSPTMLGIAVGGQHGEDTRSPITGEQIAARDAAQREENEHVIADYAARQRERQESEAKQARETFGRQITERNRANGW
jgi:hypothetical protein